MKISSTKTFSLEAFPSDVRTWAEALIVPLNAFLVQVYKILTNGITIRDNMKARTYSVELPAGATYPYKIKQSYTMNERPIMVVIGQIIEEGAQVIVPPPVAFTWVLNQGVLELYFDGLDNTKKYSATIVAQV